MKIGKFDGTLSFSSGEIKRDTKLPEFLGTPVGQVATETTVNDDWRQLHIEPEIGIAGTVLFKGEGIDRVFLVMRMPSDDAREWTVKLELERKAIHDQWLRRELGEPPYKYTWGEVVSDFDVKGVASEIIVVYER